MVKMFSRSEKWRWLKIRVLSASAMARSSRASRRLARCFNVHLICSTRRPVDVARNAPKISPTRQPKVWNSIPPPYHTNNIANLLTGGCLMMGDFFPSAKDKKVKPDVCSTCSCHNETSVCVKKTCPVLECLSEHQLNRPGECCPSCPPLVTEFVSSTCTYKSVTYQVGNLDNQFIRFRL